MNADERAALLRFKELLQRVFPDAQVLLFGSRARGDADQVSDFDVLVILETSDLREVRKYASECAWEAGFEGGIVIVPFVVSRDRWERGPERYSLLAKAVRDEGIPI